MDTLARRARELTYVAVIALYGSWPTAQPNNVKQHISSSKVISDCSICFQLK